MRAINIFYGIGIDANASTIQISATDLSFEVSDNGDGIPYEELKLVGEAHCTCLLSECTT